MVKLSPQYTKTTYYYVPTPPPTPKTTSIQPHPEPTTMAHSPRQVIFAPIPATYSRLPHDDELYVMKAFARHASRCPTCAHPCETHRRGSTLCAKGHQRALDVAQYAVNKAGRTFSVVDLDGDRRVQMEIPADCSAVRELLKATERGLRLRRKVPSTGHDETHRVPHPPVVVQPTFEHRQHAQQREPRYVRKPMLETALPPSSSRHEKKHSRSHSGRGSLYEADMRERERRHKSRPVYYSAGARGALPVPAKDYDDYYYD